MNCNNHCEVLNLINKGMDLCHLNGAHAYRLLRKLCKQGQIKKQENEKVLFIHGKMV